MSHSELNGTGARNLEGLEPEEGPPAPSGVALIKTSARVDTIFMNQNRQTFMISSPVSQSIPGLVGMFAIEENLAQFASLVSPEA